MTAAQTHQYKPVEELAPSIPRATLLPPGQQQQVQIQTQPTAPPWLSAWLPFIFMFFPPGKHQGPAAEFFRWYISIRRHHRSTEHLLWRTSPVLARSTEALARRYSGPPEILLRSGTTFIFCATLHRGYWHSKYLLKTIPPWRKNKYWKPTELIASSSPVLKWQFVTEDLHFAESGSFFPLPSHVCAPLSKWHALCLPWCLRVNLAISRSF